MHWQSAPAAATVVGVGMKFEVSFVRPVWSLQVDAPTPHPTAATPFLAPGDPFVALYGSGYRERTAAAS